MLETHIYMHVYLVFTNDNICQIIEKLEAAQEKLIESVKTNAENIAVDNVVDIVEEVKEKVIEVTTESIPIATPPISEVDPTIAEVN